MNTELLQQMKDSFDALAQTVPDAEGVEFWFARDLQDPLGYARWENFLTAIQRAIESCETTGYKVADHFRGVTKLITHGTKIRTLAGANEGQTMKLHFVPKSADYKECWALISTRARPAS